MIIPGDCLEGLKTLELNSIDSMVTDPPAGISFMGKEWDGDKGGREAWVAWMKEVMQECLRVLKPGAHAFVWAIPRTSHWTATALEDAGFEIRDIVTHVFGSGFPKSLDVSKAMDKAAGVDRTDFVIDEDFLRRNPDTGQSEKGIINKGHFDGIDAAKRFKPATSEAKQWQGWGTALKPASEHWILARKPLGEKTVAANVLKHGTGGINIDASRIAASDQDKFAKNWDRETITDIRGNKYNQGTPSGVVNNIQAPTGRFPANFVLSHNEDCVEACTEECAVAMLDTQSGILKQGVAGKKSRPYGDGKIYGTMKEFKPNGTESYACNAPSGASRFFYVAKASRREKGQGNIHPTVKSLKLMSYLITMITPPGGIVLDPFMGSGSTGVAAKGFQFIGIEQNPEYIAIAEKRLAHG